MIGIHPNPVRPGTILTTVMVPVFVLIVSLYRLSTVTEPVMTSIERPVRPEGRLGATLLKVSKGLLLPEHL